MGERKRRRAEFFAKHPKCCFCGGTRDAVEIDHQPPKIFFVQKSSPQEMRFPSCSICNRNSRGHDLIFSFFARLSDQTDDHQDDKDVEKMIRAMYSNYPDFIPLDSSSRAKRQYIRENRVPRKFGETLDEFPLMEVPKEFFDIADRSIAKLAVALFYYHTGKIAPIGTQIMCAFEAELAVREPTESLKVTNKLAGLVFPKTAHQKSYGQFIYRYGYNEDENFWAFSIKFNNAFLGTAGVFPSGVSSKRGNDRITISEDGFPWGQQTVSLTS